MSRGKHISEGKCPLYGRQQSDAYADMQIWRNRMHNERMSVTNTDNSGVNTVMGLMWHPAGTKSSNFELASRKKVSDAKYIHDFGLGTKGSPRGHTPALQLPPRPSTVAVGYRDASPSVSFSVAPPRASPAPSSQQQAGGFIASEAKRLQASMRAREIGQTFLLAGNLTQAKQFFAKAEQMLQISSAPQ